MASPCTQEITFTIHELEEMYWDIENGKQFETSTYIRWKIKEKTGVDIDENAAQGVMDYCCYHTHSFKLRT